VNNTYRIQWFFLIVIFTSNISQVAAGDLNRKLDSYLLYVCESPFAKGGFLSSSTAELCINNCKKTIESFKFEFKNDILSIYRMGTDRYSEKSLRSGCHSDKNIWICSFVTTSGNSSSVSTYVNNDGHISYSESRAGKIQTSCFIKQ
jgi:hypothetical protein